jgi:carbamoyl-phosphate synthase large subunit
MAIKGGQLYVLEANPRASRTVPFVSKAIGIPLAKLAARILVGRTLSEAIAPYWPYRTRAGIGSGSLAETLSASRTLPTPWPERVGVKEVVLPFGKFPGADLLLGPEMRSTGEVMAFGDSFPEAFAKAQVAAGNPLPRRGAVLVSLADPDKREGVGTVSQLHDLGFDVIATRGTARALRAMGIPVHEVPKVGEGRPDVVDIIAQGKVDLVIDTPSACAPSPAVEPALPMTAQQRGVPLALPTRRTVGQRIRRTALDYHVPYVTTLVALRAAVAAIRRLQAGELTVRPL